MDVAASNLCSNEANLGDRTAENSDDRPIHEETNINNRTTEEDTATKENSESAEPQNDDLYHYTKTGDFTSELFKVCVDNIPTFVNYTQLKKTFTNLKVTPRKMKFDSRSCYAYLTFRSEEERDAAIKAIDGHTLKKYILSAIQAKPKPDPKLRKRQMQQQEEQNPKRRKKSNDIQKPEDNLPAELRVVRVVTNLYDMPYQEQLQVKENAVKSVLQRLTKDLLSANAGPWVRKQSSQMNGKICCPLDDIIPSPVLMDYRNKVEYNIGPGTDGEATVGFRLGTYKDDNFAVVSPSECVNVSKEAKQIAKLFQEYVRKSDKKCYDPSVHTGCWRQLTVRTCCSGDVMVVAQIHPQQMNQSQLEDLKSSLKDLFFADENDVKVTSLYLQICGQKQPGENINDTYKHIHGSTTIHEKMMDMTFRISPDAFFQINTPAAEALYSKLGEWCNMTKDTTVLDVCCGTGTIGLSIAKSGVKKVIGIELCQQAIDDAKHNAELNGIDNAEFLHGKAEDILPSLTRRLYSKDAVAIVDPPRAGLHKKVIYALRESPAIKRLIYVSCNPKQAAINFYDLCRPRTNRHKGRPFKLSRAVPVDLFPHTNHCELILLMERITGDVQQNVEDRKKNVDELKPNVDCVEQNVEDVKPNVDELKQNVEDVKPNVDELRKNLNCVEQYVEDVKPNLYELKQNVEDMKPNVMDIKKENENDT